VSTIRRINKFCSPGGNDLKSSVAPSAERALRRSSENRHIRTIESGELRSNLIAGTGLRFLKNFLP